MLEKNAELKNSNELCNPSNNNLLINKYNSSQIKRNSSSLILEKLKKEYAEKYFSLNNKARKSDTSKHLSNNLVIRTPKKYKTSKTNPSDIVHTYLKLGVLQFYLFFQVLA